MSIYYILNLIINITSAYISGYENLRFLILFISCAIRKIIAKLVKFNITDIIKSITDGFIGILTRNLKNQYESNFLLSNWLLLQ